MLTPSSQPILSANKETKPSKAKPIKKAHDEKEADPAPAPSPDRWTQLLNEVKRDRRGTVHALLLDGQPVELPDMLRIEYDPQHTFHKESLEKHRKYLEEVVARVYGVHQVEIAFTQKTESVPRRKSKSAEVREKAELLKKTFGGEIVS